MALSSSKKKIIIFISLVLTIMALLFVGKKLLDYYRPHTTPSAERLTRAGKEAWITIFVHGSFCSPFGLLNVFETVQDEVLGTRYQKLNKMVRADPYFYQEQTILERGLLPINPSFDLRVTSGKILAAYPLIKAYDEVNEYVKPGQEHNFYYTFGWSGLLSQKVRRYEGMRLYNMLNAEFESFKKQGLVPKVRVVGHSHAGNVLLNLALIDEVLAQGIEKPIKIDITSAQKKHKTEAMEGMRQLLVGLPSEHHARQHKGNKRWDYRPVDKGLVIDESIILGCPIQPETDHCVALNTFKKMYNFYSGEDIIQKMDWISTKRYFSDQRFTTECSRLVQAKVMLDRAFFADKQQQSSSFLSSLWHQVANVVGFFVRQSNDPTHRELWYAGWEDVQSDTSIAPLPTFIFIPLLINAIEASKAFHDVDLNIQLNTKRLTVSVFQHNQSEVEYTVQMPTDLVNYIRKSVLLWKPSDLAADKKFDIINGYVAKL